MRHWIVWTAIFGCCHLTAGAQTDNYAVVSNLIRVVGRECTDCQGAYVVFDPAKKLLELNDLLIPLSAGTLMKCEAGKKNIYTVNFYMQQSTAIIDRKNPATKHAWYSLRFRTKKACTDFISLVEELKLMAAR